MLQRIKIDPLAYAAKVHAIVTGDDNLLVVAGESRILILSPSELAARIKK